MKRFFFPKRWHNSVITVPPISKAILITAFFLFSGRFQVHSKSISHGYLAFNLKAENFSEIFPIKEQEAVYRSLCNPENVLEAQLVSISTMGVTAAPEIIADCFKNYPLTYVIEHSTVLMAKGVLARSSKLVSAECLTVNKNLYFEGNPSFRKTDIQNKINKIEFVVKGKVTDEYGNPLAGVSVTSKDNKTIGTMSGEDGGYSITMENGNGILIFSFVGHTSQEIQISGRNVVNVVLVSNASSLEQVVVIGYGTQKKGDITGAASSIATKDIENQSVSRVDQALQGRASGLMIQNNSAAPDGGFTIRIRGSNSLTGSNDPLVVIDGFIGGDLSTVDPNDIADITVLKDAASTAIYGSRGANGVILVSTKKGSVNQSTTVGYNNFFNFQSINKKMDLLNAAEYAETVNENRVELGRSKVFTDEEIANFKNNGGTDWQDVVFQNALQQSHNLNLSGGSDRVNFYLSGNFANNEGIIRGSSFRRYAIRSNVESKIGRKFKVGLDLFLNRTENHPSVTGGSQDQSPTQAAQIWSPTLPIYLPDGAYSRPASTFGPPAVNNPLALAIEPIRNNIGFRSQLNTYINYEIIKGLTANVLFGTRLIDGENSTYLNTKPNGGLGDAQASIVNNRFLVLQNTNQLDYKKQFGGIHDLGVTVVYEQQKELFNESRAASNGFSSDITTYNNLALGTKPQIPTSNRTQKDIQSFVGRANYSFQKKYLLTLTGRYDGASVFGNQKWGFFPSAAVAWRISQENFMQNLSAINDFKLRASYGVTGSQAVNPYASLSQLNTNQAYAIGPQIETGVGLGTFGNPDLKWEKTLQLDFGIDISFLNERLVFNADFYNKKTVDLLMNVPLPRTSGFTSVLRNIGKVQNRGFEFSLSGSPFIREFRWNSSVNFSINRNKVLELSGPDEIPVGTTGFPNFGNTIFLIVGEPIGTLKGYIQDGIWGTKDADEAASYGSIPGAPRYVDQNHDGKINSDDIAIMGNTFPKFGFGWNNNFSYKNFDFNVFVQGTQGNKIYNETRIRSERQSSDADATNRVILNRWTPDNQNTDVPSFTASNGYEQIQSSRWLEDGSYVRIKNITLGYTLPGNALNKIGLKTIRFFASGINLFTFTKYTGFDPEASTNVDSLGGIDQAPYPSQKTYSVGLNVKF